MILPVSVLLINEVSWIGGAEGALMDMVAALNPERFKAAVICPEEGDLPELLRREGVPVDVVPFYGLKARNPLRYFETLQNLLLLTRRYRADVIHVNHQYFSDYGTILGKLCRRPVAIHLRGVETDEFYNRFANHIARADAVLCVSNAARSRLLEYAENHLPPTAARRLDERAVVVYDGFRPPAQGLSAGGLRERYRIPALSPVVGIVGQVTPEKGLSEFVKAAGIILSKRQDVHFLVVGTDPDPTRRFHEHLKGQIRQRGIEDNFTFTGFVSDAATLLSGMDVSVLASHQDAFPRVVLESLSARVPTVATRVGGVPEIVDDGISGLLVAPQDEIQLAGAIIQVLEMPQERRQQISDRAEISVSRFSVERHAQQIESVYTQLVSGRRYIRA